jgi:hypothetical protein
MAIGAWIMIMVKCVVDIRLRGHVSDQESSLVGLNHGTGV